MKLSREWLNDHVDLSDLSDGELGRRFTEIGHAVESIESHEGDTVFDLEITTNRVDAMSHLGMARELAAALGREIRPAGVAADFSPRNEAAGLKSGSTQRSDPTQQKSAGVTIRIDAPQMCSRYTALVIRGVAIKPSPAKIQRRLEAVGLRPINNVVDATNYLMMDRGHPLHAFDLDKVAQKTIIVRAGKPGEQMKSLDGEKRDITAETAVIADAHHPVALGGIIGGAESEIGGSTRNVLLECAWFDPGVTRRTARRLGIKTDASYRFERRVDPNDTVEVAEACARLIVETAGGTPEAPIDVIAAAVKPEVVRLRTHRLSEASGGVVGISYALDLFHRLGFGAVQGGDGLEVTVPAYRGDIHEEMDLIEEVLRFYGLDKIPSDLPRLTTGDTRPNVLGEAEDAIRRVLVGCGLTEVVNYSFIHPDYNALFSSEQDIRITNALTENVGAMRVSIIPGLLENAAFNRSYGTRDGALFEVGRTYHRSGAGVVERRTVGLVMYGSVGGFWGDSKRAVDFFDVKGIVEQLAQKFHVDLSFAVSDSEWLRNGKRAEARHGDRRIAAVGFLAAGVLQHFGLKGDVLAAEIGTEALLGSVSEWKMAPVARFPGIPMIMALTHGRDLEYQRLVDTIRSLGVPHLHEVGLRDRFVPEDDQDTIKTTLGMWYQAFDRSLTQEEVGALHQQLAARIADMLPVKLVAS